MDSILRTVADAGEQTAQLDLEKTVPIWWSFVWRAWLVGTLANAVLGFTVGVILVVAGRGELYRAASILLGWLVSMPVSFWALKAALSKQHGDYSVVLVKSP